VHSKKPVFAFVFSQEILDGRQYAIARTTFMGSLFKVVVQCDVFRQLALAPYQTLLLPIMNIGWRYHFRLVVHVAASPGPLNVVKKEDAAGPQKLPAGYCLEFFMNRVPVVITVNQNAIEYPI
jgi:hypothetical protein